MLVQRLAVMRRIVKRRNMQLAPAGKHRLHISYHPLQQHGHQVFESLPEKRDAFGSRHQSIEENRQQAAKHSNYLGPDEKYDSSVLCPSPRLFG